MSLARDIARMIAEKWGPLAYRDGVDLLAAQLEADIEKFLKEREKNAQGS